MALQNLIEKIRRLVVNRGLPGAMIHGARRLVLGRQEIDLNLPHPFDLQHGTQTSGLIEGSHLETGHAHDAYSTAYYGIAPSLFRKLLDRWMETLETKDAVKTYSFIDVGAGKGRAVLLASEFPFRETIGVELHSGLAKEAEKNIAQWKQHNPSSSPLRIIQQDAAEFEWPQTPLLVYLFNPFGQVVMERLIARLLSSFASHPRPLDILYVTPDHHSVLDGHAEFKRLWRGRIRMDRADRAADLVSSVSELCIAYRLQVS